MALHVYADDHKVVVTLQAGNIRCESTFHENLNTCLEDIIEWMSKYKLKMNNSKTKVITYGTQQQSAEFNISSITVDGSEV